MEKFYPTKAGIEYAALTAQGKIIEFTKGKFGDGVRSTENITELTDLIHPLGELPISKKSVKNSTIITTTQFSNRVGGSILPTFYLMEIGLFAKVVNADGTDDDEHPETLIGYAFDGHGDKIIGTSLSEFIINIPLTVADVNNVTVDIDSLVYPTLKQFENEVNTRKTEDEELQNSLNVHITDTSNPHGVTAEQIGLDKVPNVATNDQTPTYSQNSSLSNITSGEKLSVSFGKIMKAIADLISHIANQSNPHDVTAEQIGLDKVPNVTTNNQSPTFTEATTRANITSGETLSTLFGKIKKFFTDLKTVAFTGSYTDLSNKPTSMQNPNSLTLTMNGSATSYNGASSASKSWYAPTSAGTSGYEMVSNGSGAPVWKPPSYAVCSTSGNTAVKTVSISNFKLTTGVRVLVKFTYEHTSSTAATLNVNSTGAKNIVVHCGTDNIFVKDYFSWLAGETVELVYDGSYWVAIASDMRFITGAQSATVVIGTTKTQGFCDFRCDGTNDAECFNKAIRRIKTILSRNPPKEGSMMWRYGGTILVKTGVYNINSTISIGQSITKDIFTFKGEGPFSTWIQTKDLQCFMKNFNSLCFKDLYLTCDGLNEGPYFDSGDNLTFENCYISVRNSTSNVGVFADLNTQYTGEDPGGGSSGELQQGCFVLRGSTMTIKTLSTSSNCFSGINCGVLKVDDSEINLFNNSNSTSFELNFAYLAMTGYISNSIIHCSGKSSIVNSGAINITGNVIYLHSSNSRIYHYNTSITEVGGVFNANTVYCAYYVYLRCATITGNKFLKLNEYQSNSVACYLYNPCSASITGNFFHGGASGTWYIDAASKGSLNVLCNNYKGTLAVRNTVTQNNAYNLSVNY